MLIGPKTQAWFDIWSIEHFVAGATLGGAVLYLMRRSLKIDAAGLKKSPVTASYFLAVIGCSYAWESIEHYLETGLLNLAVTTWFHGVEFWGNRVVTDPLLVILGAGLYLKAPRAGPAAFAFSLTWLLVHVLVFPHCMYLQEWLFGAG